MLTIVIGQFPYCLRLRVRSHESIFSA